MTRLSKALIQKRFGKAAGTYEGVAILQDRVGQEICDRLALLRIDPQWILDLGSGTGLQSRRLSQRYPKARLLAVDLALPMLLQAKRRKSWRHKHYFLQADAETLPLATASIDMIFSNLVLQWVNDLPATLAELARVLRPGGLLIFSTVGPDTLRELRTAFSQVDQQGHIHTFLDLHPVGDALVQAGFADPVLDVEHYELQYDRVDDLLRDLRGIGAANAQTRPGLFTPRALARLRSAYEVFRCPNGMLPAHYEIIHAHGWRAETPLPGHEHTLHFYPRQGAS
ncbi:MAG: malonyl-ACP O-methyltransferase BioC [Acidithiobacillus sp.]|nr:malonyl-ACP O-methyltransferase BioC [Acidithiobacillus sp.]